MGSSQLVIVDNDDLMVDGAGQLIEGILAVLCVCL